MTLKDDPDPLFLVFVFIFIFAMGVLYVVNEWLSSATPEPTILFVDIDDEDSTNDILRIRDGHDHVLLVVEAIDDNGVVTLRLNCPEKIEKRRQQK